ncbi:SpoIIE family protein phosphatase [Clostridium grantii]|uniref:Stage II sporulation protein E (SpoIIE) n=1 Tax=Clostridium grantii DSM 8605 TaxID=1121316 RepID=A0A1M5XTN2_9CLOT|nr:SpoIIE family protein phosphatase [Clostridium grantii]SHI02878.1 Stage II sporulation protein E (SpoIIE) [Clostridium grantii DSM 8605]
MSYFIDFSYESLNKHGEELCGDHVEVEKANDEMIIVLADGMGSGVKANILATLTSKIAATMLKQGASIEETVDTIANTLPICSVRKVAYSTFTIIRVNKMGEVNIIEYDNPPFMLLHNDKYKEVNKTSLELDGKIIYQSSFVMEPEDYLTIISDGAVHAGVGRLLNLGWQRENIIEFMEKIRSGELTSFNLTKELLETCNDLYAGEPGDDTTVLTIKMRHPEYLELFTGPPVDKDDDSRIVKKMMKCDGKKVVCGGTTANIVARELKKEVKVDLETLGMDIPPVGYIEGFNLVTEGVLTLNKAVELIKGYKKHYSEDPIKYKFKEKDGATRLANMLINECTHIHFWVGKAVNPAHQNPDFPLGLNIKLKIINDLEQVLRELGKEIEVTYID